jgi:hypothetical protein
MDITYLLNSPSWSFIIMKNQNNEKEVSKSEWDLIISKHIYPIEWCSK